MTTRNDARPIYRIVLQGELNEEHNAAFAGMKIERSAGQTRIITGPLSGLAELQSILSLVSALNLEWLSVDMIDEPNRATIA